MEPTDLAQRLDAILARLDAIDARLDALEGVTAEAADLRARLAHETESRAALAEQTSWLIEVLGDARKEVRWLKSERERLSGGS